MYAKGRYLWRQDGEGMIQENGNFLTKNPFEPRYYRNCSPKYLSWSQGKSALLYFPYFIPLLLWFLKIFYTEGQGKWGGKVLHFLKHTPPPPTPFAPAIGGAFTYTCKREKQRHRDADPKSLSSQRTVGRYIYISKGNQTQTPWVFVGRPELRSLGLSLEIRRKSSVCRKNGRWTLGQGNFGNKK